MSMNDYKTSQRITAEDPSFYGIIMAAMRKADTGNAWTLRKAFPEIWDELQARYDAPSGLLAGETDGQYVMSSDGVLGIHPDKLPEEARPERRPWLYVEKHQGDYEFLHPNGSHFSYAKTEASGVEHAEGLGYIVVRLGRAQAELTELERVLGWIRDYQWNAGFQVLVPIDNYFDVPTRDRYWWCKLGKVCQGDATPYPVRATVAYGDSMQKRTTPGQWAFWEVSGILWPSAMEVAMLHEGFPMPPAGYKDPQYGWTHPSYEFISELDNDIRRPPDRVTISARDMYR